jgi:hypothetical protein
VAHLPARQREIVILRFWNALGTGEIAERLSMPAGTVRSDLTRAYAILRMLLQESFPSPDANSHVEIPAGGRLGVPAPQADVEAVVEELPSTLASTRKLA